jgi:hypothetical protein
MRAVNIFRTLMVLAVCFAMTNQVKAQCNISVTPGTNVTINCGDSVQLEAFGLSSSPALSTDFNNLQLGVGWSTTAILQYNNPCSPSLDGTPTVWYGNVPLPRTLETNAFDVSCGGEICFDLDFGADDPNPNNSCEDPDLPNEGVFIQYSIDGGATWADIFYFQPTPNKSGPYYDWANYCFTIPPAGWSSSTQFRWFQAAATNVIFDHWGIDNVVITPAVCGGIYDWSHIAGTNDPAITTVAPTTTTDYTVTYSDSIGNVCSETITVNVVGLEDPGQDAAITVCDVDASVNLFTVLGGTPDPGGTWEDVDGSGALTGVFFQPSIAGAGVYNFDYIVSGLCNTDTSTVTVTVEATANAGVDGTISFCEGSTPTQAELFAALGGNPDAGGVWTGPAMGVYTYTVTTSGACPSTDQANVVVNIFPFDINITATPIDCHGDSTTINVEAVAGTAPITGLGTFVELAGTYSYTVTDANGCTTTESITITQPDPLVVSAVLDTLSCTTGSTTTLVVTATGGVGPYTGTGVFNEGIGTYVYVVEDANKCEDSTQITVTEPPSSPVILSFSSTPILCNGGTSVVTVAATGGAAPYLGTGNFTVSVGTHVFTVTDANGCAFTDSVTLTEPAPLVMSAVVTSVPCTVADMGTVVVTASGGTPPYMGTGTFNENVGTYTYTVTDANGCTISQTVTVAENPNPVTIALTENPVACNGGSGEVIVSATGGNAPYSGTGTFSVTPGTYFYTVVDADGCSSSSSITITEPTQVVPSATSTPIDCNGGTSTVTVTATGGTAPYSGTGNFTVTAGTYDYSVTDANGCTEIVTITVDEPAPLTVLTQADSLPCNGQGTALVVVSATGGTWPYTGTGLFNETLGTYTYNVTDVNGCTSSATVTVAPQSSPVVVSLSATPITCAGGTSTVTVSATGGDAPYTGTGTFTVTAGTYTYSVTDANGCTTTESITVTESAALVASVSATSIDCNGGTADVTVSATGGVTPYTGVGTFNVSAGTYTYTVTDANGCSETVSITVSEPSALTVVATADTVPCSGGTAAVVVSATGGTAPYTGTGTFDETVGTYTYTVTDANGCTATATATVTGSSSPVSISLTSTSIDCNGGTADVTVSATGGDAPYSGTGTFSVTAGTYTYTVSDANGCTDSGSISVTEPSALVVAATADTIPCAGGTADVTVSATGGTAPYSGTGTFNESEGTYTYTVTDANGCSEDVTITVTQSDNVPPTALCQDLVIDLDANGNASITPSNNVLANSSADFAGTQGVNGWTYGHYLAFDSGNFISNQFNGFVWNNPGVGQPLDFPQLDANGGHPAQVNLYWAVRRWTSNYNGNININGDFFDRDVNCGDGANVRIFQNGTQVYEYLNIPGNSIPYSISLSVSAGDIIDFAIDPKFDFGCDDTHFTANIVSADGVDNGSFDDCGPVSLSLSQSTFDCSNVGDNTVTLTVTDNSGNTSTCTSTVTVNDNISPTAVCQDLVIDLDATGNASITTNDIDNGSSDNCGIASLSLDQSSFDCSNIGANTVTLTVTDVNGNTSTCTATVTVNDNIAPTAICQDITVTLDATGNATVTAGDIDNGSSDNCGAVTTSIISGTTSYTCADLGQTFPVTLQVIDANGNSSTCVAQVTVDGAPVVASASATSILCNGGTADVTVSASGGAAPYTGTGTFSVTAGTYDYTVTDAGGCSATVSITLTEPSALVASATSTTIDCNGGTADVTVSATGGTAPYTGTGTFSM